MKSKYLNIKAIKYFKYAEIRSVELTPFGVESIRKAKQKIKSEDIVANLTDIFNNLAFFEQLKGAQIIVNSDVKIKTRSGKIKEPNEMLDGWYKYVNNYFIEYASDIDSNKSNPIIHFGSTAIFAIINNDLLVIDINYDLRYGLRLIAHAEVPNGMKIPILLRK